ncbi:hypothetical protein BDB01DRAFT_721183 [Pilobolus umbonatus]|nr:hypothetical protein BDB01DRAFT_721183 [Pilobolus umbonatus]
MSSAILDFKPISNISESLCALHLYPNDPQRQVIAYHYCSCIDDQRRQCLIYDNNTKDAKLIGVEYIISEKLFSELPEKEKKFWHSHKYEVESGMLVLNSKSLVPESVVSAAEKTTLSVIVNTYGKIWQLWPVDDQGQCSSAVPTGPAQLLMAFTEDGQVNQDLLNERDAQLDVSTKLKREERVGIKGNPVLEGADQWTKGHVWQVKDE